MMFALVNRSTVVPQDYVHMMAKAITRQLEQDVCPNWERLAAPVDVFDERDPTPTGAIEWHIFDDPPEGDEHTIALERHSVDPQTGVMRGRVFAKRILDSGGGLLSGPVSVSASLSHGIIETKIDPFCADWTDATICVDGHYYDRVAKEVCDPVEADQYAMEVEIGVHVMVSNFVLPDWFNSHAPVGSRYDFMGKLRAPFMLSDGGYMTVADSGGNRRNVYSKVPPAKWRKDLHLASIRNQRRLGA